jgi:hypothetical protein
MTDYLCAVIIPRDAIAYRFTRHADFDEGWLTAHIAENAKYAPPAICYNRFVSAPFYPSALSNTRGIPSSLTFLFVSRALTSDFLLLISAQEGSSSLETN